MHMHMAINTKTRAIIKLSEFILANPECNAAILLLANYTRFPKLKGELKKKEEKIKSKA
jgi:hypothetical protein